MVTAKQIALHRHWLRADAIKCILFPREKIDKGTEHWPNELREFATAQSGMVRMEVMYALLFVVIEGYEEMGCKFESLDALLAKEEYVDQLRRFRNAIFHFQNHPVNEKLLNFLEAEDSEHWIRALHNEFEQFFLQTLPIKELMSALINGST